MVNALTAVGVQFGQVVMTGVASATAPITTVGAGAVLIDLGSSTSQNGTSPAQSLSRLTLTSTSLVTGNKNTTTSNVAHNFCVVDFDTANVVKSVQYVSFSFGTVTPTSQPVALTTAVTIANSFIHLLGWSCSDTTQQPITQQPALSFADTMHIQAEVGSAPGAPSITISAVVVDLWPAAFVSIQPVSDTAAPSGTTRNHAISAVTLANTLIFYAGQMTSGGATQTQMMQTARLTSTTNLQIEANSASNVSQTYNCYVVEFASNLIAQSCQRALLAVAAATSNTSAISPAMPASNQTVLTHAGNTASSGTYRVCLLKAALSSTSLVTASFDATAGTGKVAWEAMAFNIAGGPPPATPNSNFLAFM